MTDQRSSSRLRRRLARLTGTVAVFAAAAIAVAACTATPPSDNPSSSAEATQGGPLNVNMSNSPTTLDPALGCGIDDLQLASALYVTLTQAGSKAGPEGTQQIDPTKVEPYLAKSWDVSSDGLTYTFHLNTGWTFPSGAPVDAAAVKYSIDRELTIAGCGSATINLNYSKPLLISSVDAPDASTVVFHLNMPDVDFPAALSTGPAAVLDKSLIDQHGGVVAGQKNDWLATNDAGSGPYRLKSYVPGTSAVLVADPKFKGPKPGASQININYIKSDPTLLLQAKDGDADITYGLSKNSANSLKSDKDVKVIADAGILSMRFLMPNDKAPWTDVNVRKAVSEAIPYDDILKNIEYGYGQEYYGPFNPTLPGYDEKAGAPLKTDLADAKKLMAASGVQTPIPLSMTILAGNADETSIATVLQSTFKEIGIDLTINSEDATTYASDLLNGKAQSALHLGGPGLYDAGYYMGYDMVCGNAANRGHVCIQQAQDLLSQARASSSTADRDKLYSQIIKIWKDQYPIAPLYADASPVVVSTSVKHYYFSSVIDVRTWGK